MTANPGPDSSTIIRPHVRHCSTAISRFPSVRARRPRPWALAPALHRGRRGGGFRREREPGATDRRCSGGLVDIDLDHHLAWRAATCSCRRPDAHRPRGQREEPLLVPRHRRRAWLPEVHAARGRDDVELRSAGGHQTLIPPSAWYPKPGDEGAPRTTAGRASRGAAKTARWRSAGSPWRSAWRLWHCRPTLTENWPVEGSRHDAYLALAGGCCGFGRPGCAPVWIQAIDQFIGRSLRPRATATAVTTRIGEVDADDRRQVAKVAGRSRAGRSWSTSRADVRRRGPHDRSRRSRYRGLEGPPRCRAQAPTLPDRLPARRRRGRPTEEREGPGVLKTDQNPLDARG